MFSLSTVQSQKDRKETLILFFKKLRMQFSCRTLLFIIILICQQHSFGQQVPDSLLRMSYGEIISWIGNHYADSTKAAPFLEAYLNKAKLENNIHKIASGYYNYGIFSPEIIKLRYTDSIIELTKNNQSEKYPALAYLDRGNYRYRIEDYKGSLEDYLLAYELLKKYNNLSDENELWIKQAVGALRGYGGDYYGGLSHAKEVFEIELKNFSSDSLLINNYLVALSNVSLNYLRIEQPDSALIYIKEGIIKSLKTKDSFNYYRFVNSSGVAYYLKQNYKQAIDSIEKSFPYAIDNNNHLNDYYYKFMIANKLKNIASFTFNFQKIDSIYYETRKPIRELPKVYQLIIDYYKNQNDAENQLKYTNRLLEIDSIIDTDLNFLDIQIVKKYDIPLLISEKEALISSLEHEKRTTTFGLWLAIGAGLLLAVGLFYYYRKQRFYKKRFEEILTTKPVKAKTKEQTGEIQGVSTEVATQINKALDNFEKEKEFLAPGISLNSLSKSLETNSNYLSKVINFYKAKNFSNYLNDLRIEYAIEQLKHNPQFRRYSVKGMAAEVGFNSTESFSKAFHKRSGLYPSYFLKELEKKGI